MLVDTILSLGLMICFYYGLTAFAATWYFRHEARIDTTDPEYGSGGAIFGLGAVFMVFWQLRAPSSSGARCSSGIRRAGRRGVTSPRLRGST